MIIDIDKDRFDRQKRISGWRQAKLETVKPVVIGAGALGNEVVKLLLQLGVKKITIVDYDKVVKANLNRCLFFTEDDAERGELKVKAIQREAKKIYPDAAIAAVKKNVEELDEKFFEEFDCAFGCLDNIGARLQVNANCYASTPVIDGGTTGFLGKVQVVKKPSPCIECALGKNDYAILWRKYSCVGEELDVIDPKTPALPTTTSWVASVQINEFLKLLHEESNWEKSAPHRNLVGKFMFYNGLANQSRVFTVEKRQGCPVH